MLARVSSGCDDSPRWKAKRPPRRIGNSNATEHGAASSKSLKMIQNEQQYRTTLKRIERFQRQIEELRKRESNPENYRLSVGGFLAELDRMNLDIREYLWSHPNEISGPVTA